MEDMQGQTGFLNLGSEGALGKNGSRSCTGPDSCCVWQAELLLLQLKTAVLLPTEALPAWHLSPSFHPLLQRGENRPVSCTVIRQVVRWKKIKSLIQNGWKRQIVSSVLCSFPQPALFFYLDKPNAVYY